MSLKENDKKKLKRSIDILKALSNFMLHTHGKVSIYRKYFCLKHIDGIVYRLEMIYLK